MIETTGVALAAGLSVGLLLFVLWRSRITNRRLIRKARRTEAVQTELTRQVEQLSAQLGIMQHELERAEQERSSAQAELAMLKRRINDDYVSRLGTARNLMNISHEVRTPMNAVMGFAQLLRDRATDGAVAHFTDIIFHNGQKMVNLVDNIIDVFRINVNSLRIRPPRSCNLDNMLFEVYTHFNELCYKQDNERVSIRLLNIDDEGEEPCVLHTDPERLRQVLFCMVDNAMKFTERGKVDMGYTLFPNDHVVQVFVRDTGIGIPEAQRSMVFESFVQLDNGSKRKYSGLGIGMFLSKHIAERLGGNIWFESSPNSGTTFYLMLPLSTSASRWAAEVQSPPSYRWEGRRILVVDDIRENYKFIEIALRDTQAQVEWARNGKEAVQMAKENGPYDFVLMDIQMPVMDGLEATKQLRAAQLSMPIVAQTAQDTARDDAQRYVEVGCTGSIEKPININELKLLIDQHFNTPAEG